MPSIVTLASAAMPVWLAGGTASNITTNVRTQLSTKSGVLSGLVVNAAGTSSTAKCYDGLSAVITMTIATPAVVTWTAHGLAAGDAVQFTTTGTLPTGVTQGTTYFVSSANLTTDTFQFCASKADALAGINHINTSGTQSGVHSGWDVTRFICTFTTTAAGVLNLGTHGVTLTKGLFVITAGTGAADISVLYR